MADGWRDLVDELTPEQADQLAELERGSAAAPPGAVVHMEGGPLDGAELSVADALLALVCADFAHTGRRPRLVSLGMTAKRKRGG